MRRFFVAILAFVLSDNGRAAIPSETEVISAFLEAREINSLKTDLDELNRALDTSGSTSRCPLSLVHGKRLYSDVKTDRKVNDAILATRILMDKGKYSLDHLSHEDVRDLFTRVNGDTCSVSTAALPCDISSTYRRADGSCNNKQHPEWGMAGRSQERIVGNAYDDGIGKPRTKGRNNKPLPNPRTISNLINRNPNEEQKPSKTLTLHAMGFGQFLDHDITLTPEQSTVSDCCAGDFTTDWDNCFSIIIPKDDQYQSMFKENYCMEVKRSAPVKCPDVTSRGAEIRQQKNELTAFVDGSNIYGSSSSRQAELREGGTGYRLATTVLTNGNERILDGIDTDCTLTSANQHCSAAGDVRVNELPQLTSYHFLFVKEHNRIAEKIKNFYAATENEKIFQETRRILIAVLQKITYNEFLPSFLSPEAMSKYQLDSSAHYTYERNTNPTIINGFSTAAYRMGHTWISQNMVLLDKSFDLSTVEGAVSPTESNFHDPKMTYLPEAFEGLAYWLSGAASPETDRILEDAVRNKLFIDTANNKVWDLASLNIQRGRDHGLAPYNKYREWCKLPRVKREWGPGALPDHTRRMEEDLKAAGYESPEDIDLWVGGMTEKPVPGGSLGPTFECIIGEQFRRLKFGDRLWYQNQASGFNDAQRSAIEAYTLSKLLCNNYGFDRIQHPNAFLIMPEDQLKSCSEILDLAFDRFAPPVQERVLSLDERLQELVEQLEKEVHIKKVADRKK